MEPSTLHTDRELKRTRLFGAVFIIIGLCFSIHGGVTLLEIHSRATPMFELQAVFTPEKGRMWSEFLAGMSVFLVGILMVIKARIEIAKGKKTGLPASRN